MSALNEDPALNFSNIVVRCWARMVFTNILRLRKIYVVFSVFCLLLLFLLICSRFTELIKIFTSSLVMSRIFSDELGLIGKRAGFNAALQFLTIMIGNGSF